MHLILENLRFLDSVYVGSYLEKGYFERRFVTRNRELHFQLFLVCKLRHNYKNKK